MKTLSALTATGMALLAFAPHGPAQTAKPRSKASAASGNMATWSPDVQQALNVTSANFNAVGLNHLTRAQLSALLVAARLDPGKSVLTCPASGTVPAGRTRVFLTVSGEDSTGAIAGQIRQAISGVNGVDLVTTAAQADRALHVVIQEQTTARRTIGFTASYLTAVPCLQDQAGKKSDVELKGTLGTYTDAKGAGLAQDLATMFDQDLRNPDLRNPDLRNSAH